MIGWISTVFAILMGILLVLLILPSHHRARLWWALGLGPLIGLALSSCVLFLLMVLVDGQPLWVLFLDALASIATSVAICSTRPQLITSACTDAINDIRTVQSPFEWGLILLFLAAVVMTIVTSLSYHHIFPYGWFDAIMIWNVRAKYFTSSPFGLIHAFQLDLIAHGDYPLLLPLTVSRVWGLNDLASPIDPFVVQFAFFLPMIIVLVTSVASRCCLTIGLLAGLALLSSSQWSEQLSWQIADIPLAYALLSTLVTLNNAIEQPTSTQLRSRWLLLTGLLAATCAWTKNEGLVAFALIALLLIVSSFLQRKHASLPADLASFLNGAAPILGLLLLFKTVYAPSSDLISSREHSLLADLNDPSRYQIIAEGLIFIFRQQWMLPLLILAAAIAASFFFRARYRWTTPLTGLAFLLGTSASYALVYLTTPHDVHWHVGTSIHRLALHIWPLIVVSAIPAVISDTQSSTNQTPETNLARERLTPVSSDSVVPR